MVIPTDNPALYAAAGCGSHQQVYGAIIVGGQLVEPYAFADFKNGTYQIDGEDVELDDMFVTHPDYEWDPEIDPGVGLLNGTGVLNPDLTTTLLAEGFSFRSTFSNTLWLAVYELPGYSVERSIGLSELAVAGGGAVDFPLYGPRMRAAGTFTDEVTAVSGDGSEPATGVPQAGTPTHVAFGSSGGGEPGVVEWIGFYPVQTNEVLAELSAGVPRRLTRPTVSGPNEVGEEVTCDPGTWARTPTLAYQWIADDAEIGGATSPMFEITMAQDGLTLYCRVTATEGSETNLDLNLDSSIPPVGAAVPTVHPVISGDPTEGETLSVTPGTFTNDTGPRTYTWTRDGSGFGAADQNTLLLTGDEVGTMIGCVVLTPNSFAAGIATEVGPVAAP